MELLTQILIILNIFKKIMLSFLKFTMAVIVISSLKNSKNRKIV